MNTDGCNFEMSGPYPRLFECINTLDVEKQMKLLEEN